MRIASLLGAVALAASIYFLFQNFWHRFNDVQQVAILLTAAIGSFIATVYIHEKDESGYFTKLAAMVSFACFVLNLSLLGIEFNVAPNEHAMLAWAAYAFLLAYALKIRLLLAAGILCITGYISARTGTIGGLYWLDLGERPENFIPAALVLFFVPKVIEHRNEYSEFISLYHVFGLLALFLPVLVLSHWGEAAISICLSSWWRFFIS